MALSKFERKRAKRQTEFSATIAISCLRREPNGRLSRRIDEVVTRTEMTEVEAKSVMITARERHTGLKGEAVDVVDAGKPNAGTIHGLMVLHKRLSLDQFVAAEWFLERRREWARAVEMPGEPLDPKPNWRKTFDEESHEKFCRTAKNRWGEIMGVLQEASIQSRSPILSALDHILIRQQDLEHMDGDLRTGLNAIRRAFL